MKKMVSVAIVNDNEEEEVELKDILLEAIQHHDDQLLDQRIGDLEGEDSLIWDLVDAAAEFGSDHAFKSLMIIAHQDEVPKMDYDTAEILLKADRGNLLIPYIDNLDFDFGGDSVYLLYIKYGRPDLLIREFDVIPISYENDSEAIGETQEGYFQAVINENDIGTLDILYQKWLTKKTEDPDWYDLNWDSILYNTAKNFKLSDEMREYIESKGFSNFDED